MREKLRTLPLTELKKMAVEFHLGPVSSLRKEQVIDLLVDYSEKLEQQKNAPAEPAPAEPAPAKKPARRARVSKAKPADGAEKPAAAETEKAGVTPAPAGENMPEAEQPAAPADDTIKEVPAKKRSSRKNAPADKPAKPAASRKKSPEDEPARPAARKRTSRKAAAAEVPETASAEAPAAAAPEAPAPAVPAETPVTAAEPAPAAAPAKAEEPVPAAPEEPAQTASPSAPEAAAQPAVSEMPPTEAPAAEQPAAETPALPAADTSPAQEYSGRPKRAQSPFNSGEIVSGVLEVTADYGFLRGDNYLTTENDIYVNPQLIRRFNLKTGDYITGLKRIKTANEKYAAILFITDINGITPNDLPRYRYFERMTPVFPHERLRLETEGGPLSMRIMDLMSPIGKGQRGMIVSPPKAGKTTLLKQTASAILKNNPEVHLIVLLIDERPEEVTDIKESLHGDNLEVIYSTFDENPEHHKRVAEMVLARAKCLVECHQDVVILLDSITRLARAYNLLVAPSGRTLSGGLDPTALYAPKAFFGAARCMREGGSLTVLATALVETGSRMDDMIFEEFKGTGNMELVLDRGLSERRVFPAIDVLKSGTRRDDLLLTREELEVMNLVRRYSTSTKPEEAGERIRDMFAHTRTNREFLVLTHRTFSRVTRP